jgi:hypothetical protein
VWTISPPDAPYITFTFTRFDTEQLYDTVTVEDLDGTIGVYSGADLPDTIYTDTGGCGEGGMVAGRAARCLLGCFSIGGCPGAQVAVMPLDAVVTAAKCS